MGFRCVGGLVCLHSGGMYIPGLSPCGPRAAPEAALPGRPVRYYGCFVSNRRSGNSTLYVQPG